MKNWILLCGKQLVLPRETFHPIVCSNILFTTVWTKYHTLFAVNKAKLKGRWPNYELWCQNLSMEKERLRQICIPTSSYSSVREEGWTEEMELGQHISLTETCSSHGHQVNMNYTINENVHYQTNPIPVIIKARETTSRGTGVGNISGEWLPKSEESKTHGNPKYKKSKPHCYGFPSKE